MKWLSEGDITRAVTRGDARLARRWKWYGNEVEAAVVGAGPGREPRRILHANLFSQRVYGSLSPAW